MVLAPEISTTIFEQTDEPIPCESRYELEALKYPPHEADWYAVSPCGSDVAAMCEDRRLRAFRQKGWQCIPGCNTFHIYRSIRWVPIR